MTATSPHPDNVGALTASSMVRVDADATVADVAELIDANDVGAVVVGLAGVEGIISERDVVRAVTSRRDPSELRAGDLATTELSYCDAGASVEAAAALMMERYVRHLLVEEDGVVVGIVSARDLLGAFVST
jgi:CBS domain-containing protein